MNRKLKTSVKICAFILLAAVVVSSCKKSATVTPDLSASIKKYVIHNSDNIEANMITEWLDTMQVRQMDVKTSPTGINYIMEKEGEGATVSAGDSVTVKYIGFFMNGGIFDASENHGGTMTYVHKTNRMIKGWEEGIELLNKGASAVFLFPSGKAYGSTGSGPVAPNVPLIFVIEVTDIK